MSISQEPQITATASAETLAPQADGKLMVPEASQLFQASFNRNGHDLELVGPDGTVLRVPDYFAVAAPADIHAPNGAMLTGDVVARLAGPLFPGQYAQVGQTGAQTAIGQVETVEGASTVQRSDGTVETLEVGIKIFANDVVATEDGATVSITFADGTIFSLAASSRMVIDNLIYDPESTSNSASFNLVQGGFVFIAGQVAKTGGMDVSTPSATMGIRGTTVIADVQTNNGILTTEVSLTRDPDGSLGEIVVQDLEGNIVANITGTDTKWVLTSAGEAFEVTRSLQDDAEDNLLIAEAVGAFRSALARVDAGETFVSFGDTRGLTGTADPQAGANSGVELDSVDEPDGIDAGDDPDTDGGESETLPFDEGRLQPEEEFLPPDTVITALEDPSEGIVSGAIQLDGGDGAPLQFAILNGPENGTATVSPDGQFQYVPSPNFNGNDQFTYQVTDGDGINSTGTVIVQLTPVNDAPVFDDSATSVAEDGTVTGTVAATDVDGDPLTYALDTPAANGGVVVLEDGTFNYTPNPDFSGSDTFNVRASDPSGESAVAAVTVTVDPSNDAPVVVVTQSTISGATTEGDPAAVGGQLVAQDADTGDLLTWSGSADGDYGAFTITAAGVWSYVQNAAADALGPGETATDVFTATVTDSTGATDSQLVTITLTGTNDAALITGDTGGAVLEDAVVSTVSGSLVSTDVDGPDNSFQAVPSGAATANGYGTYGVTAAGVWTFTLNNGNAAVDGLNVGDAPLTDSFMVLAADGTPQIVTVTISGSNDAAIISGVSSGSVVEDAAITAVSGALTSADVDNADDTFQEIAAGAVTDNGFGTYGVTSDGVWTFTLDNSNAAVNALNSDSVPLTDQFTVLSVDGTSQVVTVSISGSNDGAVISGQSTGAVTEDATVQTVSGNLTSVDADSTDNAFLAVAAGAATQNGLGTYEVTAAGVWTFALDNTNAAVDALNADSAPLTDQFTVFSVDGTAQIVTVTISGSNDAALISGDSSGMVTEDAAVATVSGALTSTDVDNANNLFLAVDAGASTANGYGTYAVTSAGVWTFTLDNSNAAVNALNSDSAPLTDQFTVLSADGTAQVVTVSISGSNDGAVISGQTGGTVTEDAAQSIIFGTLFSSDVDNADNVFQPVAAGTPSVSGYGTYAVTAAGVWSYTLNNAAAAVDALAEDGAGLTDSFVVLSADGTEQEITIIIEGSNDAPRLTHAAADATGAVTEGTDVSSVSGQLAAVDPDVGAVLSWDGGGSGTYGVFEINAFGAWTYTLNSSAEVLAVGQQVTESFDVSVSDGQGGQTMETVSVTVSGTNQAPVVVFNTVAETAPTTPVEGQLTAQDAETAVADLIFALGAQGPTNGAVIIDPDGSYTYTPNGGFQGVDRFEYTVTDDDGGVTTAQVEVEVVSESGGTGDGRSATLDFNTEATADAAAGSVAIITSEAENNTINLAIAMDRSGSIGQPGWEAQVDAVLEAVEGLATTFENAATEVMVQIITYATNTVSFAPVELQDFNLMRSTLLATYESGATRWDRALADAQTFFDGQNDGASGETNILLFITDGQPTEPPDIAPDATWQAISEDLKTDGGDGYTVTIQAFGIGPDYDSANPPAELAELAGSPPIFLSEPGLLTAALEATPVFNPTLVDFELTLEVDGGAAQVIADESSSAFDVDALEYEVALAEIAEIYQLLGDSNRFSATARFDLDGDTSTSEIELFSTEVLGAGDTAQTLSGLGDSDLLFGSTQGDDISGQGGNDLILGYDGEDTLDGGAGQDTVLAGGGDDTLIVADAPTAAGERLDGGAGQDVLEVGLAGDLNAALLDQVDLSGIEALDMDNGVANSLTLVGLDDVFDLSGAGDAEIAALLGVLPVPNVAIAGDTADTLDLQNTATTEYARADGVTVTGDDGAEYAVYQYFGNGSLLATLAVDAEVEVTVTPV